MHDDLYDGLADEIVEGTNLLLGRAWAADRVLNEALVEGMRIVGIDFRDGIRSEEHTSELQSQSNLVCRLLLEKKKKTRLSTSHTPSKLILYLTEWACTSKLNIRAC